MITAQCLKFLYFYDWRLELCNAVLWTAGITCVHAVNGREFVFNVNHLVQ
jgi:hypothetical protein